MLVGLTEVDDAFFCGMHSSLAALGIQRYFNYMPYPFALAMFGVRRAIMLGEINLTFLSIVLCVRGDCVRVARSQ
jgi:hypothetical protein